MIWFIAIGAVGFCLALGVNVLAVHGWLPHIR